MPLSAKKGVASYNGGGVAAAVKVRRAPLVLCLKCPLCSDFFREATTVSECLHTFCRECIHNHLGDGETNSCPVCSVSLGTLPLEKLRADHQLDDVKAKIFPDACQSRKHGQPSGGGPSISGAPIQRQERNSNSSSNDEHEEMEDDESFHTGEEDEDEEGSEKQEGTGAADASEGPQGGKKKKGLRLGQPSAQTGRGGESEGGNLERMTLMGTSPKGRRSFTLFQKSTPAAIFFGNGVVEQQQMRGTILLKHPGQPANGSSFASTALFPNSYGVWFALQAASNQSDNPLPQLTSPYLRIKDGKLPVSHVKKYLVKKLGLNHETEVEITCRGQPVVSSLPLESVRNIWFATVPQEQEDQVLPVSSIDPGMGLAHLDAGSAKEFVMVLTYQRHRRNLRIC